MKPLLFVIALLASMTVRATIEVAPGVSRELADYRAAHVSELQYQLYFDLPADLEAPIPAQVVIDFALSSVEQPLQLDFRHTASAIKSLRINGIDNPIDYRAEHIVLPVTALQVGANTVEISFQAGPSSLNRNPHFLYTLFVPDRARTAFPLFDQPNLKARYELTLDVPKNWKALSNSAVLAMSERDGKTRYRFARTEPISSYLFSFVAGQFDVISRQVGGRVMNLWHREPDRKKLARNVDTIFELHAGSLAWMESYTGIAMPYSKFDFVLIPDFPYGGMEHVGAIQYRASSLLLEESATESQQLGRASLIAHETAHMWFGNLVTMNWFDDVWTKEVFANLMAGKIVNPAFPQVDHQLDFLASHYPGAYHVDRSAGANPIRQHLPNLDEAGQMYGDIIYHKAPIMMRQLEMLLGEEPFRLGLQAYLRQFAMGNAAWPELVAILDSHTDTDLAAWSEVWVDTPGRPEFQQAQAETGATVLTQLDTAGTDRVSPDRVWPDRVWPQRFGIGVPGDQTLDVQSFESYQQSDIWLDPNVPVPPDVFFNADGLGYGLFPASTGLLYSWPVMSDLHKGALLINLYENVLAGAGVEPGDYVNALLDIVATESNQLVLDMALHQLSRLYTSFLTSEQQLEVIPTLETTLWDGLNQRENPGEARLFLLAFSALASSPPEVQKIYQLWSNTLQIDTLTLSEADYTRLAEILAIRLPDQSSAILDSQMQAISNPDKRRRLQFIAPALSGDIEVRDAFFASLADEGNRRTENWVLSALAYLHHPSRREHATRYLPQTLALLPEVQRTGDIFFPAGWLNVSLQNHNSIEALAAVDHYLAGNPSLSSQLRMKVQQAADLPARAQLALANAPIQPQAENVDLKEVVPEGKQPPLFQGAAAEEPPVEVATPLRSEASAETEVLLSTESVPDMPNKTRRLLGVDIPPSTTTRLNWTPSHSFSGMAIDTPVLAVNGAYDGPTLCLTAAIHGDEINGIEMVRRVMYNLDPTKLHGMVVGVPIVNLLGFSRNSRYLPDRRDLNRYFPGNPHGSMASRIAYGFFNDVVMQCNALVDLHTGSFHRTNITQLRVDMTNPDVVEFAELFGDIPVLNTAGNPGSLRAAAVRAGIPAATLEAGEPMRMQVKVVEEGVAAVNTLLDKNGMYPSFSLWAKPKPAFYRSSWVRANASGILFSRIELGDDVRQGDVLGEVINPVTNEASEIVSELDGRILGMALDQFVLPGFAIYHIGIRQPMQLETAPELAVPKLAGDDMADEQAAESMEAAPPLTLEQEGFDD